MNEPSTSRGSGCGRGRNRRCSCGRGRMWGQQAQGVDEEQYRWRELPQVWFLSRQTRFCRAKTRLLSRQKYTWREKKKKKKSFLYKHVLYLSPNNSFVATNLILSRQKYTCREKKKKKKSFLYKHVLYLSPNNSFVATNLILSRQKFCRNKHTFVATKDLFCRDKAFVATKIVLAAVPANDRTGSLCGNMYY